MPIITRKFTFLGLLVFLASCSSHCRQWELSTIQSDCPNFTYSKVYLPTCNTFKGLNAEIITSTEGVSFYLGALTFEFQQSTDEGYTTVYVQAEGVLYAGDAIRMEGGQKLILPEELQVVIVTALVQGNPVDITVGRYQETLIPDNFESAFSTIILETAVQRAKAVQDFES